MDEFDTPTGDVARDQWGRYVLPDRDGQLRGHTRVTTFITAVDDLYRLEKYHLRMALKGMAHDPGIHAMVAATPLGDRSTLDDLAQQAMDMAGARVRASLGTAMHKFTERYDRGEKDIPVPDMWVPEVKAYIDLVDTLGLVYTNFEEIVVVHDYLTAGTFDRIARITTPLTFQSPTGTVVLSPGDHVMVDLKTGRDMDLLAEKTSVQLALYNHADGVWRGQVYRRAGQWMVEGDYAPLPDVRRDVALIIHLPIRPDQDSEAVAELFAVDTTAGWAGARLCWDVRQWRRQTLGMRVSQAPRPASPQPTEASPRPARSGKASPRPARSGKASPRPARSGKASPQPTEASPQPAEASPRPTEASPRPAEASPRPAEASPQPTEASPRPAEASPQPTEASPRPAMSLRDQVLAATSRDELSQLWQANRHQWTPDLTELGKSRDLR